MKSKEKREETKERKAKTMKSKQKGITLIALVITIIVLLILAGVTIAMVVGNNGILIKAQKAKEKTESADKSERANIDRIAESIDEQVNGEKRVEQVTDEHPGELENVGSEKIINSIEDLVFFANSVTNGNSYEGETIKLGLSLDFNSSKSYVDPYTVDYKEYGYDGELKTLLNESGFIPIGKVTRLPEEKATSMGFKGIFDGNNCKIYNLKINQSMSINGSYGALGLFSFNNGKIKNLCIEKSKFNVEIYADKFQAVGILVGHNVDDGLIENCSTEGNVTIITSGNTNVGGLCGANDGDIKCCYSSTNMETKRALNAKYVNIRFGGVVGANSKNIDGIYFNGSLNLKYLSQDNLNTESLVGGLVGYLSDDSKIIDSYSVGSITCNETIDKVYVGPLGYSYGDFRNIATNCYYLKETINSSQNDNVSMNLPAVRL